MTTTPDLEAIKARQQATWATGDFATIAALIVPVSELLAESTDLQAGWRVLDVATGSGNTALAAARRNTEVTGLDYVPALLERGRVRAAAEALRVRWVEGDAEKLPFEDGSFDAVMSSFGCMFAPDHQQTVREMARVCRRGGRIAMANWTPEGFPGQVFRLMSRYNPPPPGLTPPVRWGTEAYLAELFKGLARPVKSQTRTFLFRYRTPRDYVRQFREQFGPVIKAFEAAGKDKEAELERELVELIRRFDRNGKPDGPVAVAGEYLEAVMERE